MCWFALSDKRQHQDATLTQTVSRIRQFGTPDKEWLYGHFISNVPKG